MPVVIKWGNLVCAQRRDVRRDARRMRIYVRTTAIQGMMRVTMILITARVAKGL